MGGSTAMDKTDYNRKLQSYLVWPLLAYGALFGYYAALLPGKLVWFSWHPVVMLTSFVVLAANAALIKKIGGYENTKIHGYLMTAACIFGGFAWYVIYSNKEMSKKSHLTTLHGKLGCGVMCSYILLGIVGGVALHPDFGIPSLKSNKTIRFAHKWGGRVLTAFSWMVCVLGFNTMEKDQYIQAAFALPLLIFGFFVLL